MDDERQPPRGPLEWVRGHPGGALLAIVTALAVGLAIGLVVSDGSSGDTRAEARLAAVEKERDTVRARLHSAEGRLADLTQRVEKLSAASAVPSFVGKQIADVEANRWVSAYNWKLKTTDRVSRRASGTVLRQLPGAGATLNAGGAISLVVAKKTPLKPRRWVSIGTLSGAGATRTDPITVPSGLQARLVYDMPQGGNNAIVLYRAQRGYGKLLFSELGPRRGVVRLHEPGRFYLEVTGSFRIQVQVFRRPQ